MPSGGEMRRDLYSENRRLDATLDAITLSFRWRMRRVGWGGKRETDGNVIATGDLEGHVSWSARTMGEDMLFLRLS